METLRYRKHPDGLPKFSPTEIDPATPLPERFSDQVSIMVPGIFKGELNNGHFADFLNSLHRQKGLGKNKIGVVIYINDHLGDQANENLLRENSKTFEYLSLIELKDTEAIKEMTIPQEYKEIALAIIQKDQIEIRTAYGLHDSPTIHWGKLRRESLNLLPLFKNTTVSGDDIIIDPTDTDTTLPESYYADLLEFYASNPNHKANYSEEEFKPGEHEDAKERDISRDVLRYFDEYRLYQYGQDIQKLLNGDYRFIGQTPNITGRYSLFYPDHNQLDSSLASALNHASFSEDFAINQFLDAKHVPVGHVGEVYWLHRTRTLTTEEPTTEAEYVYKVITEKGLKGKIQDQDYDLLSRVKAEEYIDRLEQTASITDENVYQSMVTTEEEREREKINIRQAILIKFLRSHLPHEVALKPHLQRVINPFIRSFPHDIIVMQHLLYLGKNPEEIVEDNVQNYTFLNPDASIHSQIARLRALKSYIFSVNKDALINELASTA